MRGAGEEAFQGQGAFAAELWGRGKSTVCSLSHCVGRGCAGCRPSPGKGGLEK